jgi:hypothetical protein
LRQIQAHAPPTRKLPCRLSYVRYLKAKPLHDFDGAGFGSIGINGVEPIIPFAYGMTITALMSLL